VNKDSKRVFEVSHWFKDTLKLKGKQLEMPPNLDKLIDKGNSKPKHQVFIGTDRYDGIYPRCTNEYFYPKSWLNNFNSYPRYSNREYYGSNDTHSSDNVKLDDNSIFHKLDLITGKITNLPANFSKEYDMQVEQLNEKIRNNDRLALSKKEVNSVVKDFKNNDWLYKYDNLRDLYQLGLANFINYPIKSRNIIKRGVLESPQKVLMYGLLKAIEHANYNTAIAKYQQLKKGKAHSFKTKDLF